MLKNLKKLIIKNLKIGDLPEEPGIYIFWDKNEKVLYVGKAKNLKNRLRTYFAAKLLGRTLQMVSSAVYLSTIEVNSELEALLLEAKLVREMDPPYNSALKDDKHPLYIKITDEIFPRVITVRKNDTTKEKVIFGPFPSSENVSSVLFMIRKIFPYSNHKLGNRPCFYRQLGLCNPCPNEIIHESDPITKKYLRKTYLFNINSVRHLLDGKLNYVRNSLVKEMKKYSKENDFENAVKKRDQLLRFEYINQPITKIQDFIENPNLIEDIRKEESSKLKDILYPYLQLEQVNRIECYDVAHLSGFKPTASMVTFVNGIPDKNYYRHFRIRQTKGNDDLASLNEVANRRLKHFTSWGKPDLIIVDGGKGQVTVFNKVFSIYKIPVLGLAKREETLVIPLKGNYKLIKLNRGPELNLLQRIRNEAHRFARRYHHQLLKKDLFKNALP